MNQIKISTSATTKVTTRGKVNVSYEQLKKLQKNVKYIIHVPCLIKCSHFEVIATLWPHPSSSESRTCVDAVVFDRFVEENILNELDVVDAEMKLVQLEKNATLNATYLKLKSIGEFDEFPNIWLHDLMVKEKCYLRLSSFQRFLVQEVGNTKLVSKSGTSQIYRITSETVVTIEKDDRIETQDDELNNLADTEEDLLVTNPARQFYSLLFASQLLDTGSHYSVLIHGPPATGKTFSVKLCAKLLKIPLINMTQMNESFEDTVVVNIQKVLQKNKKESIIIFIDDLQQQQNEMVLLSHWEKMLVALNTIRNCRVIIVGAASTDTSESGRNTVQVKSALRSKFQREVSFELPTQSERAILAKISLPTLSTNNELFSKIGEWTVGHNMGSLQQLLQTIRVQVDSNLEFSEILNQVNRICRSNSFDQVKQTMDTNNNPIQNEKDVWNEIGGLQEVKEKLQQSAQWPIQHPDAFKRLGLTPPRGILLYGPPGCAKTTLVRVLAKATHSTFIYCNVAQVYSPFVGESEASLRKLFTEARIKSPSVIFLDEIDALVGKRDFTSGSSSGGVESRILSTLLNEMDGIEQTKQLLVIAATNRPDMIDNALMRPGRLDHILYVPPPDEISRKSILEIHSRNLPVENRMELVEQLGASDEITGDMTGAELEALCREACMIAMRQYFMVNSSLSDSNPLYVNLSHFMEARKRISPALRQHPEMVENYRRFEQDFYQRTK